MGHIKSISVNQKAPSTKIPSIGWGVYEIYTTVDIYCSRLYMKKVVCYDNDNDNDKVFYSTIIIHFILHITVINAFAYHTRYWVRRQNVKTKIYCCWHTLPPYMQ